MLIAVMGDSHDNRKALEKAVSLAVENEAKAIFHTGDLISPFMLGALAGFSGMVYLAIGNNDGDTLTVSRTIPQQCPQVREYGRFISVELEGVNIATMHYPDHARAHASSANYDLVFYGHTHKYSEKVVGETLLLNPGDLYGLEEDRSFCLVDTDTREVKRLFV